MFIALLLYLPLFLVIHKKHFLKNIATKIYRKTFIGNKKYNFYLIYFILSSIIFPTKFFKFYFSIRLLIYGNRRRPIIY